MKRRIPVLLVAFMVTSFVVVPGIAQTYRVEIRDGHVWLNGQLMPDDELPPGLLLDTQRQAKIVIQGKQEPLISIDGYRLCIRNNRLEWIPEEAPLVSPDLMALVHASEARLRKLEEHLQALSDKPEMRMMEQQMQALARQLELLQKELRRSAETLMEDAGAWGARLYGERIAEQHLEIKSRQLAARIRQAQDNSKQLRLRKELRELLEELFELKQENRRNEIRMLRGKLKELEKQLRVREKHRDAIIDRRMRELIGEDVLYRW